jgi:hypothetical protein
MVAPLRGIVEGRLINNYTPYLSAILFSNTLAEATRYAPYYRVSTARQGQSSFGLEALQAVVRAFSMQDLGKNKPIIKV